jgi:septal ring factor EnvC (AmiA/AmiB activator)
VLSFRPKKILAALILSAALFTISFSRAQTPDANQEQRLLALIKEVQVQQAQLAENQTKIDEKLAQLEETIHDARIYGKRSK